MASVFYLYYIQQMDYDMLQSSNTQRLMVFLRKSLWLGKANENKSDLIILIIFILCFVESDHWFLMFHFPTWEGLEAKKDVSLGLSLKYSQPAKHHSLDQEIFFSSILQKKQMFQR